MKNLISIDDLNIDTIANIFEQSDKIDNKINNLKHNIGLLFFESSTRTIGSFKMASKILGLNEIDINVANSALNKGESIRDMIFNLKSMNVHIFVIRIAQNDACRMIANINDISIINAGDGINEHPTQALGDLLTILKYYKITVDQKKDIEKLRITICGDVKHSRVCHSLLKLFQKVGMPYVTLISPPYLMNAHLRSQNVERIEIANRLNAEILSKTDVLMMLRVQKERLGVNNLELSTSSYQDLYGLNFDKLMYLKKGAMIMHPGPINRNMEISDRILDITYSSSNTMNSKFDNDEGLSDYILMNQYYNAIPDQVKIGIQVKTSILQKILLSQSSS